MAENTPPEIRDRLKEQELLLKQVDRNVSRLLRVVLGDGDERALVTRVDRIEQFTKRAKWVLGGIFLALIPMVFEAVRDLFRRGGQ